MVMKVMLTRGHESLVRCLMPHMRRPIPRQIRVRKAQANKGLSYVRGRSEH